MIRMSRLFLGLILLAILMGSADQPDRDTFQRDIRQNLNRFGEVYRNLAFRYVDQIDPEAAIEAAIRGLMDELDPYSDYFIEDAAQQLADMSRGEYGGIGMEVGLRGSEKHITVISPFEGSPAWDAGLQSGDEIVGVDGTDVRGKPLSDVVGLIKGKPDTPVVLRIARGSEEADYSINRALITIRDVRFAELMDPAAGIGYIRLTRFSGKASENLATAISELNEQGMRSLILDLRGNPGGLLREAAAVADLFLDEGLPIVLTKVRDGVVKQELGSRRTPLFTGELVVLINGGSASASEIVAGSLQDNDRAVVLGSPSFGKGLVQSVIDLDDEAKIKLTTGRYFLPSGRLIQRIDYFEDNEVLIHHSDSTLVDTLFHTMAGREVVGGRGISPDIDVEAEKRSWLVTELWRNTMFSNYIADRARDGRLPDGRADRSMLKDFRSYVEEMEFEYRPRGMTQLEELEKILAEEAAADAASKALKQLRKVLNNGLDQQMDTHQDELLRMLDLELASLRGGAEARTRLALQQDIAYERALEVLHEKGGGKYDRALHGGK